MGMNQWEQGRAFPGRCRDRQRSLTVVCELALGLTARLALARGRGQCCHTTMSGNGHTCQRRRFPDYSQDMCMPETKGKKEANSHACCPMAPTYVLQPPEEFAYWIAMKAVAFLVGQGLTIFVNKGKKKRAGGKRKLTGSMGKCHMSHKDSRSSGCRSMQGAGCRASGRAQSPSGCQLWSQRAA